MKKTYILTEIMRSSKSGFFIEGTDIAMDYPDEYPVPMETEVLEKGRPISLRLLPHCPYLEREKQLKNGFPQRYTWNDVDRRKLTFRHRMLELDDKRDAIWVEYLDRSAWIKGNEDKKPRNTTKTLFEVYNYDAIIEEEILDESRIIKAKNTVLELEDSALRNLYRLANPGTRPDSMIKLNQMRKYLLQVAANAPDFIINGIKTNADRIVVLISRAIEERIVSLEFPASVALFHPGTNEWQKMITVNDTGGQEDKFDRLVDYLQTDAGATDMQIIEQRLSEIGDVIKEID